MSSKTHKWLNITYSKRRRRKRSTTPAEHSPKRIKTEDVSTAKPVAEPVLCQFCLSSEDNEVELGPIHKKNGVAVHYFCLLLSSGLIQNTIPSDKSSILGFTIPDILKELKRGKRLSCCYCHKKGATIGCCVSHCRRAFHLRCGRQHGSMHHFYDSFTSFCAEHWLTHGSGTDAPSKSHVGEVCSICLSSIDKCRSSEVVFPPCCKRAYFHHKCMQKYAMSAGMHYFRCPLCNGSKDFQKAMLLNGLYIPDRDASWEKEPNAFQELLERPSRCGVSPCMCPHGEVYNASSGKFKLLICELCGSYCAHRSCAGLSRKSKALLCPDCDQSGPS